MNLWEKLRRQIGNELTTYYVDENNQITEYKKKLFYVVDCIKIDYGMEDKEFLFVSNWAGENIYKIVDNNGNVIYENPKALTYSQLNMNENDIIDEQYRLFGDYFLKSRIASNNNLIETYVKYNTKFRNDFNEYVFKPENNLSYWYEKTKDLGFKTPKTEVFKLPEVILNILSQYTTCDDSEREQIFEEYKNLMTEFLKQNSNFKDNQKLFIKSGVFSCKFDFSTCQVNSIEEIAENFLNIYLVETFKARRGHPPTEIVLREFIQPSYKRKQIYNGMPLNTEFRVFYDFDRKKLIGIENYWNPKDMKNGLNKNSDINNYLDEQSKIENDFKRLKPYLKEEVEQKLKNAHLQDKWSVDFMWDGKEFVLIDMAYAQCSHAWERYQHLTPDGFSIESVVNPKAIEMPERLAELINQSGIEKE